MDVWMDVRMYVGMVDDVMAIKPNFLALMGYQYFLSYGAWHAQSYAIKKKIADLLNKKEF